MLRLSDLVLRKNSTKVIYNLQVGKVEEYQIGSTLLHDYMIGINYKEGKLSYGLKGEETWFDIFTFLWILLWINIVIFVAAVAVLVFEKRIRN